MYASAMKFCGAMELCGIGYPRSEPADYQWPDVEAQMSAQKAGLLVAITREANPAEAELMTDKGFAAVYKFTNPRTGNVGVLWVKDFTGGARAVTTLPQYITGSEPYLDSPPTRPREGNWAMDRISRFYATRCEVPCDPPNSLDPEPHCPYTGGVDAASSPASPTEPGIY